MKRDNITIIFPNGRIKHYCIDEFDMFYATNELEHRHENIIINVTIPDLSFVYEKDEKGEIIHKEWIKIAFQ